MSFGTVIFPDDHPGILVVTDQFIRVIHTPGRVSAPNELPPDLVIHPTHMRWVDATNSHKELTENFATSPFTVALDITFSAPIAFNMNPDDGAFSLQSVYPNYSDVQPVNAIPISNNVIRYFFNSSDITNKKTNRWSSYGNYVPVWDNASVNTRLGVRRFSVLNPMTRIVTELFPARSNHPRSQNGQYRSAPQQIPIINPPNNPPRDNSANPLNRLLDRFLEWDADPFSVGGTTAHLPEVGGEFDEGVLPAILLSAGRELQNLIGGPFTRVKGDYQLEDVPFHKDLVWSKDDPHYYTRPDSTANVHVESVRNFPKSGDFEFSVRGNNFLCDIGAQGPNFVSSAAGVFWREASNYFYKPRHGLYKITHSLTNSSFFVYIDNNRWASSLKDNTIFNNQGNVNDAWMDGKGVAQNAPFIQGNIMVSYNTVSGFTHTCLGTQLRHWSPLDVNDTTWDGGARLNFITTYGYKQAFVFNAPIYIFVNRKKLNRDLSEETIGHVIGCQQDLTDSVTRGLITQDQYDERIALTKFPGNAHDGAFINIIGTGVVDAQLTVEAVSFSELSASDFDFIVGEQRRTGDGATNHDNLQEGRALRAEAVFRRTYADPVIADTLGNAAFFEDREPRTILLYGHNDSNYVRGISQLSDVNRLHGNVDIRLNDSNLLGLNYKKLVPEDPKNDSPWCLEP